MQYTTELRMHESPDGPHGSSWVQSQSLLDHSIQQPQLAQIYSNTNIYLSHPTCMLAYPAQSCSSMGMLIKMCNVCMDPNTFV